MSPEYVPLYVKAQKTDDRDVEAIAEAATRPTMRLVTPKSEAQLDLQILHRARARLFAERTRLTDQLRAVLLERGIIVPQRRDPHLRTVFGFRRYCAASAATESFRSLLGRLA